MAFVGEPDSTQDEAKNDIYEPDNFRSMSKEVVSLERNEETSMDTLTLRLYVDNLNSKKHLGNLPNGQTLAQYIQLSTDPSFLQNCQIVVKSVSGQFNEFKSYSSTILKQRLDIWLPTSELINESKIPLDVTFKVPSTDECFRFLRKLEVNQQTRTVVLNRSQTDILNPENIANLACTSYSSLVVNSFENNDNENLSRPTMLCQCRHAFLTDTVQINFVNEKYISNGFSQCKIL